MTRGLTVILFAVVGMGVSCVHSTSKTAASPQPPKSAFQRHLDEQWLTFRAATAPTSGRRVDEKEHQHRVEALQRATYTDFQGKRYDAGGVERKMFDAKSAGELKMFPSKESDVRRVELERKNYATQKLNQPMVERQNYTTTRNEEFQSKRFETTKTGLRDVSGWRQKTIPAHTQTAKDLISQTVAEPTKATQATSNPVPILPQPPAQPAN